MITAPTYLSPASRLANENGCSSFEVLACSFVGLLADCYWRFQLTETAIYLALALALVGYCFRRLSRLS